MTKFTEKAESNAKTIKQIICDDLDALQPEEFDLAFGDKVYIDGLNDPADENSNGEDYFNITLEAKTVKAELHIAIHESETESAPHGVIELFNLEIDETDPISEIARLAPRLNIAVLAINELLSREVVSQIKGEKIKLFDTGFKHKNQWRCDFVINVEGEALERLTLEEVNYIRNECFKLATMTFYNTQETSGKFDKFVTTSLGLETLTLSWDLLVL